MKAEKFICNGQFFNSFDECESYARLNGYRITNTETINTLKGRRHIISIGK